MSLLSQQDSIDSLTELKMSFLSEPDSTENELPFTTGQYWKLASFHNRTVLKISFLSLEDSTEN